VLSAIDQVLPRDPRLFDAEGNLLPAVNPEQVPYSDRREIYITEMETRFFDDLKTWENTIILPFRDQQGRELKVATPEAKFGVRPVKPPTEFDITGPGWVIEFKGHHFFNSEEQRRQSLHGLRFVKDHLLQPMLSKPIQLPNSSGQPEEYLLEDIGVYYPTVVSRSTEPVLVKIPNPAFGRQGRERGEDGTSPPAGDDDAAAGENGNGTAQDGEGATPGEDADEGPVEFFEAFRYDFILQMAYIPTTAEERDANKAERLKKEAAEAAGEAAQSADGSAPDPEAGPPPAPDVPPDSEQPPPGEPPADNPADPASGDAAPPGEPGTDESAEPPPAEESGDGTEPGEDESGSEPPADDGGGG
jgi:type IV pilus assembly protein PilM